MEKAIEIRDLCVSYGNNRVLENINLTVEKGEYLGIMGPNGGGKSTLLKSVLGLIPITSGEVKIFGNSVKQNKKTLGYVPQFSAMDKKFPITVREVVQTAFLKHGLHPLFRFGNEHKSEAEKVLSDVGLDGFGDKQISELSGGEFQRVLIARALAAKPAVLLLDEPTASVDPASREKIYSLIGEINKEVTVIMVTHDMTAVASEVKKLACLNQTLVYHGQPELTEKVVNKLYGCPVDLIAHGIPHRVLKNHDGGDGCCC